MEKELISKDDARKIIDIIKENAEISNLEEMIKNNYISFKYGDIEYRVRLLNREDKDTLYMFLVKKYNSLLEDKEIKKESELIKIYKEVRGIDIEDIDKQIRKLIGEGLSIQLKLGEAISKKVEESGLVEYRKQIEEINEAIDEIKRQKENLLAHSLEKILEAYEMELKVWLALEKKVNDEWTRVFATLEEFRKFDDDVLLIKATHLNSLVQIK